jgi:uncharacterized protein (TIGR02145 family)
MRGVRVVKAPALLAFFGVIFVAGVRYAAIAETQTSMFTDDRDGKAHKTVVIGGKRWMAENLNVETEGSWCYDNKESNCEKYGRLYNWNAAKTVCPAGWHLPSREEWGGLAKAVGGDGEYGTDGKAGKKLKSTYGWNKGDGTDEFGFSALPGGYRYDRYYNDDGSYGARFLSAGFYGYWWTATADNWRSHAYNRRMGYNYGNLNESEDMVNYGFSVRCVCDD